jgi:hypothetical protein
LRERLDLTHGPKKKITVGEDQDTAHNPEPKNLGGDQIRTKIQTRFELNTRATSQENRPDLVKQEDEKPNSTEM